MADPEAQQPLLGDVAADTAAASTRALDKLEHWTRKAARTLYSGITHLGTSALLGLITGFALRTIGQTVAIALVLLFLGFQVLAYYGFVNFNWRAIGSSLGGSMDLTENGRLDMNRVKTTLYSVVTWTLSWGILSVLGFLAGFWIGWKLL